MYPFKKLLYLCKNPVVFKLHQLNGLGRTFRDTHTAAMTFGWIDFGIPIRIDEGNVKRANPDADQTGGT